MPAEDKVGISKTFLICSFYGYTSMRIIFTEYVAKFFSELQRVHDVGKYQQIGKGVPHLAWHDIVNSFKHDLTPNLVVVY